MKETRFKQTEIGLVPEEWRVVRLGEVCTINRGASPRPIDKYLTENTSGINWIRIGDVSVNSKYIISTEQKIIKEGANLSVRVAKDDFILSNSMSFGRPYILNIDGCIHDGWLVIKNYQSHYNIDCLYYLLLSERVNKQYLSLAAGSGVKNLNKEIVANVRCPLPPHAEQLRIAGALSSVDGLLSSLSRLIEKKRALRTAAMQQLLTAKTRLPGFTEPWKEVRLGEVASIKTGKRNGDEAVPNGLYPFFVRSQEVFRINSYSYDGEAIIVPGEGNIGSIFHYINGKFDFHQRVYKISDFSKEINAKYLFFMMKRYFGPWALSQTVKATVDSLRLPTFENFRFPLPTLPEQRAIASALSEMDRELSALCAKRSKIEALRAGMMQDLLSGRIRLK